jgi:YVTN family beta-propeller protein
MKKATLLLLMTFLLVMTFTACKKDDNEENKGEYSDGIFIVNEGLFQTGTGTITFVDRVTDSVSQDIFKEVNGRPLGSVAQSMTIANGKAYIVVNYASKVEVVDAATFQSVGTITGLVSPRYVAVVSTNKGYISDWAGNIAVVDLESNTISKTIAVKSGPEQMLVTDSKVYILNSGGWSTDSTISVIDPSTDEVVNTIQVNHRPTGIVMDKNGKIWVICSGRGFNGWPQSDDTKGHLLRIDPATLQVDFDFTFPSSSVHPEKLVINKSGDALFFLFKGAINRFDVTDASGIPEILALRDNLYSLGYDAVKDYLYVSNPLDYQQNGWIYRYRSTDGTLVDSMQAGVIPGNFCFGE